MNPSGMSYPDSEIYYQARAQNRQHEALEARVTNLELAMRQLLQLLEEHGIEYNP